MKSEGDARASSLQHQRISLKDFIRFFLVIAIFQVLLLIDQDYIDIGIYTGKPTDVQHIPTTSGDGFETQGDTSPEAMWKIDPSLTRILESLTLKQRKEIEELEQHYRLEDDRPLNPSCGIWQQAYINKHKEAIKPSSIRKAFETWKRDGRVNSSDQYLIHYCPKGADCGGVADHLFGAFSMFLHSLLTNKTFLIDWPEELWYPEKIDWNASRVMMPVLQEFASKSGGQLEEYYLTQSLLNWPMGRMDHFFNMNRTNRTDNADERILGDMIKRRLDTYPFTRVLTNHGSVFRQLKELPIRNKLEEWGLHEHNIYSCLWQFLFPLRGPEYDYTLKYKALLQHPDIFSVTIHVRNGDDAFLEDFQPDHTVLNRYINCTHDLVRHSRTNSKQRLVFLIVSDSEATVKEFARRFPNETLLTGTMPSHFSMDKDRDRDKLLRPITDNIIMSYSSYAIHSRSGFARLSSFVRGNHRRVKLMGEWPDGCFPGLEFFFMPMDHMAKLWSLG